MPAMTFYLFILCVDPYCIDYCVVYWSYSVLYSVYLQTSGKMNGCQMCYKDVYTIQNCHWCALNRFSSAVVLIIV